MNDFDPSLLAAMSQRNLPARLDVQQVAKLLGFTEDDLPILISRRRLVPLGKPAPNARKWFATIDILKRSVDPEFLDNATKEVSLYWKNKNARRTRNQQAAAIQAA